MNVDYNITTASNGNKTKQVRKKSSANPQRNSLASTFASRCSRWIIGQRTRRRLPTTSRFGRRGELVFGWRGIPVILSVNQGIALVLLLPIYRRPHSGHLLAQPVYFFRRPIIRQLLNRCCRGGHRSTIVIRWMRRGD